MVKEKMKRLLLLLVFAIIHGNLNSQVIIDTLVETNKAIALKRILNVDREKFIDDLNKSVQVNESYNVNYTLCFIYLDSCGKNVIDIKFKAKYTDSLSLNIIHDYLIGLKEFNSIYHDEEGEKKIIIQFALTLDVDRNKDGKYEFSTFITD